MMLLEHMLIDNPQAYETGQELDVMTRILDFDKARILELGCGSAWMTRALAARYPDCRFIATEVDEVQHQKNLSAEPQANLEFRLEGAQSIAEPDASVDTVFMLKSLHHVPAKLMESAMDEIARVLKPGGVAYFSEPVYQGEFNALMSLIHDEKQVRELAFAAIHSLAGRDEMALQEQVFLNVPGCYESWEQFESRFLKVTHTRLDIDAARYQQIKSAFMRHMGEGGAHFLKPHRIDVVRKRLSAH
ncbi:MAG: class I SAM-dependent methyltransferase [Candidatus Thiodiazotropha sp.]